jgi:hypothetical protein
MSGCGCGGTCETPLHPKRHLVMRRNWAQEPQEHAIEGGMYRKNMNPEQFKQLRSTEAFNHTPLEG